MNGLFNTGLSFWEVIGIIFSIALSVIAVKITLSLDINKYLERRDEKNIAKLRNACTHIEITPTANNKLQVRFLYESPAGTLQWQCQRCGLIMSSKESFDSRAYYYAENHAQYIKQQKKFNKLLKKSGMV